MSQCRLFVRIRKPEANYIQQALAVHGLDEEVPVALEAEGDGWWALSLYVDADDVAGWKSRLRDAAGGDLFGLSLGEEMLDDRDWVSENQRALSPVRAGRYVLHGSHDAERFSHHPFAITVDAGQAFGTGHHGTTAGCLDVIDTILRARRPPAVVDLGTGYGVLAIAVARTASARVLATDIDPISIVVARENARLNGVAHRVDLAVADGFSHPVFRRFGQADLMIANILAGPLVGLAPGVARHVTAGGDLVLSGLMPHQAQRVRAAYRGQGFTLVRRHDRDGWTTLHLRAA